MSDDASSKVIEVVGRFADRAGFERAVKALRGGGFEHADISVLDSHESLEAAGEEGKAWQETLTGLVGEIHYVGPLTAAGLIAIAAGPIGASVAALVAAGVTGLALREALDEIQATPHTEAFAKALEQGAVLLWVVVESPEEEARALQILSDCGAADVHRHEREVGGAD